jgi:hypothetical protein
MPNGSSASILPTHLLTLPAAARRCPRVGDNPSDERQRHPAALWRWCRKGILARSGERVRLKHYRIGGRLYTTEADLVAFFDAVTAADAEHFVARSAAVTSIPTRGRPAEARAREVAAAQAELQKEGF